jgi:uncharacterized membrane protein YgcG
MRRGAVILVILAALGGAALGETERILDYRSDMAVRPDGSMAVRETIKVRAEGRKIQHGIYRDFPTLYGGPLSTRRSVPFRITQVLRDGRPEPYHTKPLSNGLRVYIGHENVRLQPGAYTYILDYETDRQVGFFADHDELYWNVTGTGWDFAIGSAAATVSLPASVPRDAVRLEAYTGPQGARGQAFTAAVDAEGRAAFATTRPLGAREGLTVVVSWPKGFVREPPQAERTAYFVRDNLGLGVGVLGLLVAVAYYVGAWVAVGKDPARGLIIPLFEPPEGLSPAQARYLMHMGYDNRCMAAAVLHMAVKGYLTVQEADGQYALVRTDRGAAGLAPEEEKAAACLFKSQGEVFLRQYNHQRIGKAVKALRSALASAMEMRYFVKNRAYVIPGAAMSAAAFLAAGLLSPRGEEGLMGFAFMCVWLAGWTVGVAVLLYAAAAQWRAALGGPRPFLAVGSALFMTLFALPFLGGEVLGLWFLTQTTSVWMAPLLLLAAAVNVLFYHLMKAPTQGGRRLMDLLEGFRMYLGTAERDRLNILYAPRRTPELFEKYLPYAIALDVENEWAAQFSDVLAEAGRAGEAHSPSWYNGTSWSTLGAGGFASSIGGSLSGAIASSSTAPGSSSGGGGGGSSGGGGGGGGGGGW